jgi:hypothetical protein
LRPQNRPTASPCLREVRAERVQLVVSAGDHLLHHRLVRLGLAVGALHLDSALAAEGLLAEAALEPLGRGRLHEHREADPFGLGPRLGCRPWVRCARRRHSCPLRRVELAALRLDRGQHLPGRERVKESPAEPAGRARDRVERLVVGREHRRAFDVEPFQERDECLLVLRVRGDDRLRVARAKAERAGPVVEREHADPRAAERADRRQPVHPAHVDDDRGVHRASSSSSDEPPSQPAVSA